MTEDYIEPVRPNAKEPSGVNQTDQYCLQRVYQLLREDNLQEQSIVDGTWDPATKIHLDRKYRLKPVVYPSINWNEFKGNYIAVDCDGYGWGFMDEPESVVNGWVAVIAGPVIRLDLFMKSFDAGNCHWEQSLIERPGYDK